MIDYRKIWESINNESKNSLQPTQIARKIPSSGIFNVFLATDFKKGIRLLYIKLEDGIDLDLNSLSRFRGLEISIFNTSLGEFKNSDFIKFTQSIPNTDNIFELVISELCDQIIQLKNVSSFNTTLKRLLNEWKLFFEKQENKILSIKAQKGLMGELYFLKDYIFRKYSYSESLTYWTGADKSNHDFQILRNAMEVKTTSSKQHKKFNIASEKQLDNTGVEHLYLTLYSFNLHIDKPDQTLPALINEIYIQVSEDPIATFFFQLKLLKYGYNEALAEKYKVGFSVTGIRFFEVREGFPRLLSKDLPEGVGDLKYTTIVAACTPYEIDSHILNHI